MSEFDPGHGYNDGYGDFGRDPAPYDPQTALWVMGAIDELRGLGIIEEIAGENPLGGREDRKRYRELKKSGFVPQLTEAMKVVKAHVLAEDQPLFERLFRGIIEEGWESIRRERDLMLEEERQSQVSADDDDDPYAPFREFYKRHGIYLPKDSTAEGRPDAQKKVPSEEEPRPRPEDYGFPSDWVLL